MSLLTHTDAGGDEEFFKTINRAYQILMNDGAQEAYNNFGLDEAEKLINPISVATIAAARAQYVLSFVVERGTCLKYKDWSLVNK